MKMKGVLVGVHTDIITRKSSGKNRTKFTVNTVQSPLGLVITDELIRT